MNADELVRQNKFIVKSQIFDTIYRICTGDCNTCTFGYCKFNFQCAKLVYKKEDLDNKKLKTLKFILKNAQSKERKKLGIVIPNKPKQKKPIKIRVREKDAKPFENTYLCWRLKDVLGQSIFKHELVAGCPETKEAIRGCINMRQVVKTLESRYNAIHEKPISLPGKGRDYYKKFMNEPQSK